ncbi:MAG: hypothetical protein ABMA14_24720, partial [Hyphomonadaceae bacterium]
QAFGVRDSDAVEAARASAGALPAPTAPAAIANVQVKVTSAVKRGDGKYRFTLEDGQIWEQIDSDAISGLRRLPLSAEIKAAAFGSFMMKIEGNPSLRVRRVK